MIDTGITFMGCKVFIETDDKDIVVVFNEFLDQNYRKNTPTDEEYHKRARIVLGIEK